MRHKYLDSPESDCLARSRSCPFFFLILVGQALLWSLLSCGTARAADTLRAFEGASSADLARGLSPNAFPPRFPPGGESLEGYSFWIHLDDGSSIVGSLIISNLGKAKQPALSMSYYPAEGGAFRGDKEFDPEDLKWSESLVQVGPSYLRRLDGGDYCLHLDTELRGGGGRYVAEFKVHPTLPPLRSGDGRVHFGKKGKYFELLLLWPRANIEGYYSVKGASITVKGVGYGDHASQNLYPHHVANRWFNFRFFSKDLFIAGTSATTLRRYEQRHFHHVVVANEAGYLFRTDQLELQFSGLKKDPESGYGIPAKTSIRIRSGGGAVKGGSTVNERTSITLELDSHHYIDRLYMLQDLNPLFRAFLRTFIAKPYTYRHRLQARALLTGQDGRTISHNGTFLSELIFVND